MHCGQRLVAVLPIGCLCWAFALLDQIVAARSKRSLTTLSTLWGWIRSGGRTVGASPVGRVARSARHHEHSGRAVPGAQSAARPAVPAPVLTDQLRRIRRLLDSAEEEGWDQVLIIDQDSTTGIPIDEPTPNHDHDRVGGPRVVLQISRFPWGDKDPGRWLRDLALTADEIGFDGLALMDHLIQIPQVDRAWEPIPIHGSPSACSPVSTPNSGWARSSPPSPFANQASSPRPSQRLTCSATAAPSADSVPAGGCEHQAYGLDFPNDRQRLDRLQVCIETLQRSWAPGTKAYHGRYVHLPETTCYPRPVSDVPIIVGGSERRTLRIAAEQADGCNLPSDQTVLRSKIDILHRHCAAVGRDPESVEITVLDLPVIGTDREDVAVRVERLRGRLPAAVYAARHHAAAAVDHAQRYRELADLGVRTIFVALPDLSGADDLARCAPLLAALRRG